jgi:hypothetical protein
MLAALARKGIAIKGAVALAEEYTPPNVALDRSAVYRA